MEGRTTYKTNGAIQDGNGNSVLEEEGQLEVQGRDCQNTIWSQRRGLKLIHDK